ncbi:MAG: D-glycero-beta-D-manno-heptose 1-phosphate adenylyltransferase [bacterium]
MDSPYAALVAPFKTLQLTGRRVVFTNGCFDLLHPGHVALLTAAKTLGDFLIVGINDDDSVRRLKGPDRPLFPLAYRQAMVVALKPVDAVIPFSEDTPLVLITELGPDVLVKGGDYALDAIVGREIVEARGGKVQTVPFVGDWSTTTLVGRLRGEG